MDDRVHYALKLLFATDLHGNRDAYDALFDRAARLAAGAIVLGGDLLPLPIGVRDPLGVQRFFARDWLAPRLRRAPCRVFALLGNDDWAAAMADLEDAAEWIHGRAVPLDERLHIAGYSCVPLTPFSMSDFDRYDSPGWTPPTVPHRLLFSGPQGLRTGDLRELLERPTIAEDLDALAELSDPARTVYVIHTPPQGTNLDLMHGHVHIGSAALRDFIERRRPPLTLHGHIHESPELSGSISDAIGGTLCVNPGDSRNRLRAVFVDTDDPFGSLKAL